MGVPLPRLWAEILAKATAADSSNGRTRPTKSSTGVLIFNF